MNRIQANQSGTRSIEVTEEHLLTLKRYALMRNLIDSTGVIDEQVVDKLRYNVRSLLESENGTDKQLLDLCLDVIYNVNMKAFGLQQLVELYAKWDKEPAAEAGE